MTLVDLFGLDPENFKWVDLAMCVNVDINAHFEDADKNEHIDRAVRDICDYCPVKSYCLEQALENETQGIHGARKVLGGKIVG